MWPLVVERQDVCVCVCVCVFAEERIDFDGHYNDALPEKNKKASRKSCLVYTLLSIHMKRKIQSSLLSVFHLFTVALHARCLSVHAVSL